MHALKLIRCTLPEAIETFRESNLLWSTQIHLERCGLKDGIKSFHFDVTSADNPLPSFYCVGINEQGLERAEWHSIVSLNHWYVDWTARQYWESAPFPLIIPHH